MLYVSIDIETSGLDAERNQVLSIGAIIEDTNNKLDRDDCPTFYRIITHKEITGNPFALTLNQEEISLISAFHEGDETVCDNIAFVSEDEVAKQFYDFLWENNMADFRLPLNEHVRMIDGKPYPILGSKTKPIRINVAGKNFGTFDKVFLEKLPWWQKLIKTRHKIIDPGVLFVNWVDDDQIPSLDTCKERANIKGVVTHNALDDAWDVIELLRNFY